MVCHFEQVRGCLAKKVVSDRIGALEVMAVLSEVSRLSLSSSIQFVTCLSLVPRCRLQDYVYELGKVK